MKMNNDGEEKTAFVKSFNKSQKKYGTTKSSYTQKCHIVRHQVARGDTLQGLALRYNTTVSHQFRVVYMNDQQGAE